MIQEDYVSSETAKLLKEKGFDLECETRKFYPEPEYDAESPNGVYAPTLQTAMKWLREKYNMNPVPYTTSIGWYFEVFDLTRADVTGCALLYQVGVPSKEDTFDTCEAACEAAIKYCLENLI